MIIINLLHLNYFFKNYLKRDFGNKPHLAIDMKSLFTQLTCKKNVVLVSTIGNWETLNNRNKEKILSRLVTEQTCL